MLSSMKNVFLIFTACTFISLSACKEPAPLLEVEVDLPSIAQVTRIGTYSYAPSSEELWIDSSSGISHIRGNLAQHFALPVRANGIEGTNPNNVWVLTLNNVLFHFNGKNWHRLALNASSPSDEQGSPQESCNRLWIADEYDVWIGCSSNAVGVGPNSGVVYHYTGTELVRLQIPEMSTHENNQMLTKMAGTSSKNIWFFYESYTEYETPTSSRMIHWNGEFFEKSVLLPDHRYAAGWSSSSIRVNENGELSLIAYDTQQSEREQGVPNHYYILTLSNSTWSEIKLGVLEKDPDPWPPHDGNIVLLGPTEQEVLISCRQEVSGSSSTEWSLCKPSSNKISYIFPSISELYWFLRESPDRQTFFVKRGNSIITLNPQTWQEKLFFSPK